MTEHLFSMKLGDQQKARLRAAFENPVTVMALGKEKLDVGHGPDNIKTCYRMLTPAVIEQLAGEHDEVDGFLDALERLP